MGNHLSHALAVYSGLSQEHALTPQLFNFVVEYVNRKIQ